jgi:CheY-like chemotaxis protein
LKRFGVKAVYSGYHIPKRQTPTRALNNGAVGFLSKPFDDRSLMECLTDAIKLHHESGN